MIKVLNLYAGIGGNRKLWQDVDVTAIEIVPEIAKIYQDFFPNDKVIVTDAHQYLLEHFKEYDFIWSSPPCPTHSRARFWGFKNNDKVEKKYPDMNLYQEIIFLQYYYKGKFVVENVKPFYKNLLPAYELGRHLYWTNFYINKYKIPEFDINKGNNLEGIELHGFNINQYKGINKKTILRNCIEPGIGLHIFKQAFKQSQLKLAI